MEASDRLPWFSYSFNSYLHFLYLEFSKFERAVLKPEHSGYLAPVRMDLIFGLASWCHSSVSAGGPPSSHDGYFLWQIPEKTQHFFLACFSSSKPGNVFL